MAQVSPSEIMEMGTPTLPKRKSGRRSWFSPNKILKLELAVEPEETTSHKDGADSEDDVETLLLTHFTKAPRIDFGKVRIGKSSSRRLRVRNPHDYEQEVIIEKFPFKKNFTIELTQFVVDPEDDVELNFTWTPEEGGNCREMVLFQVEGVYRLQTILFGQGEEAPKPKRLKKWKGMGVGTTKGKKPFSVLQDTERSSSKSFNGKRPGLSKMEQKSSCNGKNQCVGKRPTLSNNMNSLNTAGYHDQVSKSTLLKLNKHSVFGNNGCIKISPKICVQDGDSLSVEYDQEGIAIEAAMNATSKVNPHISNDSAVAKLHEAQSPTNLLPMNPRRTTFNKGSPRLPNTPVIEADSPRGRRIRPSPVLECKENTPPYLTVADLATDSPPSTLRRCNTYTKLNSSLSPKPRKLAFTPENIKIEEVDENNVSVVGRRRSDSSVANSSGSSCMFEDSLMVSSSKTPPGQEPKFFPPVVEHVEQEFVVVEEIVSEQVTTTVETQEVVEECIEVTTQEEIHEEDFTVISRNVEHRNYQKTMLVEEDNSGEFFLVNTQEFHDSLMCQEQGSPDSTVSPGDVLDPNVSHEMVVSKLETVREELEQRLTVQTRTCISDSTLDVKDLGCRRQSDIFGKTVIVGHNHISTGKPGVNSTYMCGGSGNILGKTVILGRDSVSLYKPDGHVEDDMSMVFSQTILRKHGECEFKPPQTPPVKRMSRREVFENNATPDQRVNSQTVTKTKSVLLGQVAPQHDSTRIDSEQPAAEDGRGQVFTKLFMSEIELEKHVPEMPNSPRVSTHTVTKSRPESSMSGMIDESTAMHKITVSGSLQANTVTNSHEFSVSPPIVSDFNSQKSLFPTVADTDNERRISTATVTKTKPIGPGLGSPKMLRKPFKKLFTPPMDHCGVPMPKAYLNSSPSPTRVRIASPSPARRVTVTPGSRKSNDMSNSHCNKVNNNSPCDSNSSESGVNKLLEENFGKERSSDSCDGTLGDSMDSPLRPGGVEVHIEGVVPLPHDSPCVLPVKKNCGTVLIVQNHDLDTSHIDTVHQRVPNGMMDRSKSRRGVINNKGTCKTFTSDIPGKRSAMPASCSGKSSSRNSSARLGAHRSSSAYSSKVTAMQGSLQPPHRSASVDTRTASSAAKPPRKENPSGTTRWKSGGNTSTSQRYDLNLTRTQQLRRQAALASMNGSASVRKAAVEKERITVKSATTGKKPLPRKSQVASGQNVKKPQAVKGLAQSKLTLIKSNKTALPKHPLPFASKNMYYDERWMEKQERGFVRWLNFILTPPDEYFEAKKQKVDAGALCMDCPTITTKLAPTKETLSFKAYAAKRRLNRLRRAACRLFQSEAVVRAVHRLEIEIESKRLAVRKDRKLHADLGIKQKILDMVLSYNPLWLRIGLETVYGEILPVQSNMDILGISRFVVTRFLGNPDISSQFAHPTVPHLFRKGYDEALAQFTLKKFLLLVYFLDQAKQSRLIDHNPCLFCCDSDFKSSRDMLLIFSRDYLSGEGDITRHLSYMGLTVSHVQTALDEYNFAVKNLASDLRDGVRLARVVELLVQNWCLSKELRVPAISRLQKVHNVEVAFCALSKHGLDLETPRGGKINPRDVTDGHQEKTLHMLWKIIFNFQVDLLLSEQQLREEVQFLRTNLLLTTQLSLALNDEMIDDTALPCGRRSSTEPDLYFTSKLLSLLLKWCRAVCAYYDMKVENFTVSFSDGRALCYLVHHYHPELLRLEDLSSETSLTYEDKTDAAATSENDDSFDGIWTTTFSPTTGKHSRYEELLANERHNFKLLHDAVSELGGIPVMVKSTDMSGTIPDEKVVITYVSYLCSRLLDIRMETRAARLIQATWRRFVLRKHKNLSRIKHKAACIIQRAVRLFLLKMRQERLAVSVVSIQCAWRGVLARRKVAALKKKQFDIETEARCEKAAIIIQSVFRMFRCQKRLKCKTTATVKIQAMYRGHKQRRLFSECKIASTVIQRFFRAHMKKNQAQNEFQSKKASAVIIQRAFRRFRQRCDYTALRTAAICIQAQWRSVLACRSYKSLKCAAVAVQTRFQANRVARQQALRFRVMKNAALVIQASWRCFLCRRWYLCQKSAAVIIQSCVRGFLQRQRDAKLQNAVRVIQNCYRARKVGHQVKQEYKVKIRAVRVLQAACRGWHIRRVFRQQRTAMIILQAHIRGLLARRNYQRVIHATILLQKQVRAHFVGRRQFQAYHIQRGATITIQSAVRGWHQRKSYQQIRAAAITIQSRWIAMVTRKEYVMKRLAAEVLQTRYRALKEGRKQRDSFLQCRKAAVVIQSAYRRMKAKQAACQLNSVIKIQAYVRMYHARRHYLQALNACVKLQAITRMFVAKKKFVCSRQAAIIIQTYYRAHYICQLERRHYLATRDAVVHLQACFRGYLCRKALWERRDAATRIQILYRAYRERNRYVTLRKATLVVQTWWRSRAVSKQLRQDFLATKTAAILIQATFRGRQARQEIKSQNQAAAKIQTAFRSSQTRKKFLKMRKSTITLQHRWRAKLRGVQVRREFLRERSAVITIQSAIRGLLLRQNIQRMKQSACVIQSVYRGYLGRSHYRKLKKAATNLQNRWRATLLCRRELLMFLNIKMAVITIQAAYRGHKVRKEQRRLNEAAIVIQTQYRSFRCVQQYLKVKLAVVNLQMRWRANYCGQQERKRFLQLRGAATVIQANVKGFLVKRYIEKQHRSACIIQAKFRSFLVERQYSQLRSAAVFIQKRWKTRIVVRRTQQAFIVYKKAVKTIQAAYRGHLVRRELRKQNMAVSVIQKHWKARHYGYLEREGFLQKRKAAVLIQASLRGMFVRRKIRMQNKNACVIQAQFRCFVARKWYSRLINATVCIQRRWKAKRYCKIKRHAFLIMKAAAVAIQATYRMHRVRCDYVKAKKAAVTIQATFRGHQHRQEMSKRNIAATVIQSKFRGYLARNSFKKTKASTIQLQHYWRARQLGLKVRRAHLQQKMAAVTLQAAVRGFLLRQNITKMEQHACVIQSAFRKHLCRSHFLALKKAVTTIQRRWRARKLCKATHHKYLVTKGAAITIQAALRGHQMRKIIKRQNEAAVVIQTAYRSLRKKQQYLRVKTSVKCVQKYWRAKYYGQRERARYIRLKKAVIVIQSCLRSWFIRRELKMRSTCACLIQTKLRCFLALKRYSRLKSAAVCIQRRWRAKCLVRRAQQKFLFTKGAVITIQAAYRAHMVRKELEKWNLCATVIQSRYRAFITRKKYAKLHLAVEIIQKRWRSICLSRQTRRSYLISFGAALAIQAAYRGYRVRVLLQKQQNAAIAIQSMIRGYQTRKNYFKVCSACLIIQHFWRARYIGRICRREFLVAKGAAMTIQAAMRRYFVQKQMRKMDLAAAKIQSLFKMCRDKQRYHSKRRMVVVLQQMFRANLMCRRMRHNFLLQKGAAITIQSIYRGNKCRHHISIQNEAATKIQAAVKGYFQRSSNIKLTRAVTVIQTQYRALIAGRTQQAYFHKQRNAALTIQSFMRGTFCRRELKLRYAAACKIQLMFRCYCVRKRYVAMRNSAVVIQTWFRSWTMTRVSQVQYQMIRRSVICVQATFRAHIKRKHFVRVKKTVVALQRLVQTKQVRQHFLALRSATVIIQAHWRSTLHSRQLAAQCIQHAYRKYRKQQVEKAIIRRREVIIQHYTRMTRYYLSAVKIQRCVRRYRLIRSAKRQLKPVIIIQRWMRAKLQRLQFLKVLKSVRLLQSTWRHHLNLRHERVILIQAVIRGWLERKRVKKKQQAATLLQAVWRGRQVRRNVKDRKVRAACQRVQKASAEATEEKKLCNRTTCALDFLLQYKQLSYILVALMDLEVSTRLSWVCCERIVQGNAVGVIYQLIRCCNRSLPHMELIKYSVDILLNLAKYEKTRAAVYEVEDSVDTLVKLMVIFREKGSIFTKTCTLLGIMCHDPDRRKEVVAQTAVIDKLRSIHALTRRKHVMEEKRQIAKNKMAAARSFSGSFLAAPAVSKHPKIHPDWVLRRRSIREIEDPLIAINFVINTLQLHVK